MQQVKVHIHHRKLQDLDQVNEDEKNILVCHRSVGELKIYRRKIRHNDEAKDHKILT